MLHVRDISTFYGRIQALSGVSIDVHEGEIVTLIGSNGAGKTTTLRSIHGLRQPSSGSIEFLGRDVTGTSTADLVRLGMAHAPEGRRVFPRMSVRENLHMGAFTREDGGIDSDVERVFERFPRLRERSEQHAGSMSGGEQQMLAIGRALMSRPKLLMLDEPSMGLAPKFIERIFETIVEVNEEGTTVLLVEQNANLALEISDRAYVLESGSVALQGSGQELRADPKVREAYLGEA